MKNHHRLSGEVFKNEKFLFPAKITTGEGEINKIDAGPYKAPFLFAGPYVMKTYGSKIIKNNSGIKQAIFAGQVWPGEFYRIKKVVADAKTDVLYAMGGGKVMDLAKLIKKDLPHIKLINIPTSAATCAAMTPVSVMYSEDGEYMDTIDSEVPDEVIVDYEVLSTLPMTFYAAGAADTLAKYYETTAARKNLKNNLTASDELSYAISTGCKDALKKIIYLKWHKIDETTKRKLADINIIQSGLASCAGRYSITALIAHAAAHAATAVVAARQYLHGEHAAAGLIVQETMLKGKKHLTEINSFFEIMELPLSLSGIGIKKANLKVFYDKYTAIDNAEQIAVYAGKKLVYNILEAYL
ncbi:MAG: iron-containing alcohol dehydrogenase [bacterium]